MEEGKIQHVHTMAMDDHNHSGEGQNHENSSEEQEYRALMKKWWWAAIISVPVILVSYPNFFPGIGELLPMGSPQLWWARLVMGLLALFVVIRSGGQFFIGTWEGLKQRSANMNTLIAIGVSAAWLYSLVTLFWPQIFPRPEMADVYYDVTTVVTALVVLGSALEMKAKGRSSGAINKLIALQPQTANVVRDGKAFRWKGSNGMPLRWPIRGRRRCFWRLMGRPASLWLLRTPLRKIPFLLFMS